MYYCGICLEGLRKTIKVISHDNQSSGYYFNPGPLEYKGEVLTIQSSMFSHRLA
jgi:hypothetical protein